MSTLSKKRTVLLAKVSKNFSQTGKNPKAPIPACLWLAPVVKPVTVLIFHDLDLSQFMANN
jgi:hypothetical protein